MLPSIYKAPSDRGPYCMRLPKYYIFICDHDSHCLQTLFNQFYKIGTSLNFIESDQTLHDATPGLGLLPSAMFAKSDKLQTLGKTKKMPTLVSLC